MDARKMKPSEETSIVPKMLRDKFREYKERERQKEIQRQRENTPAQKPSSKEDSEALKELIETNDTVMTSGFGNRKGAEPPVSQEVREMMSYQDAPRGMMGEADEPRNPSRFAKGGMVKKKMGGMVKKAKTRSHRGDGIATRGFTKGRMY
jgi:hypothetical protein